MTLKKFLVIEWINLVSTVIVFWAVVASGYVVFEDGHDYYYIYSAESNIIGLQNISTVIKIRIRHLNKTENGDFNQLLVDSFFQRTQDGQAADNPLNWDLSRTFLFQRNWLGEITFVHHHKDDEFELINLKKAISGVFSVRVQSDPEKVWSYAANETDHAGTRENKYFAERNFENGITLQRFHHSHEQAEKKHEQVMKISPSKEIHHVEATDSVVFRNKFSEDSRAPLPGEFVINDKMTGEVPVISTSSRVKVVLKDKIRFRRHSMEIHDDLRMDSILTSLAPPKMVSLSNASSEIDSLIGCIRNHTNKYAPNRTECVHNLRNHMQRLSVVDLLSVADKLMNVTCSPMSERCLDDRYLGIDLLAQMGAPEIQLVLIQRVLRSPLADEEEMRRILVQFIGLKEPHEETIKVVRELCVGKQYEYHGTHNNTKQTHRACLTLGALVKTVAPTKPKLAAEIVIELANWLRTNDGSTMEHASHRIRRSVPHHNETHEKYKLTKMVLIEALGNTGHPRALNHILSYSQPNIGHSAWRRSGISALRWYTCRQSAAVLMDIALNDYYDTVREQAYKLYVNHPQRRNMSAEERDMVFAEKYTYPVVMQSRSKRSLADIFRALSFKLELPGIEWGKVIGTSAIGASFGLTIRNRMELQLKPLSGFFEIDIYNHAYVKALLGFLGKEVDIFKALACYQGYIRYDLNVLKDFGINDVSDLANLFDKVVSSVKDPIVNAVAAFKKLISFFKEKGIKGIINDLVNIVRDFPNRIQQLVNNVIEFIEKVSDYDGLPWIKAIKKVIFRVRYFIEDVQSDILNFYNSVVDTITVTLPFVIRRVIDAINSVVGAVKQMFKNPMAAISSVLRAIMNIKMSVSMLIGAKQKIEESCFFLSGELPYWMNPGNELEYLIEDIKVAFNQVKAFLKRSGSMLSQVKRDPRVGPGDGILTQEQQEREIAEKFLKMLQETLSPVEELRKIAEPFINAYNSIFDVIRSVKKAYFDLKTIVDKSRALIRKLFGPKFHVRFPSHRVDCDDSPCACGNFPSTVNSKFLDGVDIRANSNAKLVNPVVGLVKKRSDNEVIIIPGDDSFREYEIIISNVKPLLHITTDGVVIEAGKPIGNVMKSQCNPNFIHFVMRKTPAPDTTLTSDDEYEYVNPTQFLDRIVPVPMWIEECKEYTLYYIGQTADKDKLGEEARKIIEDVERKYQEAQENPEFELEEPDPSLTYRPPGLNAGATHTLAESFQAKLNMFKDIKSLFTSNTKAPNILDLLDVNKFSIRQLHLIFEKAGQEETKEKLADIVEKFSVHLRDRPIKHPVTYSPSKLRSMLKQKNLEPKGSFEQMVLQFLSFPKDVCVDMMPHLGRGEGMFCLLHKDCLGATCGVVFALNFFKKVVKLDIRYNACIKKVEVNFGSYSETFSAKTGVFTFDFPVGGFGEMMASAQLSIVSNSLTTTVNLKAQLCSKFYPTCAKEMQLFDQVVFRNSKWGTCLAGPSNDQTSNQVMSMKLDHFAFYVLEERVGNRKEFLNFMNEVRVGAMDALISNPELFKEIYSNAFPSKLDVCIDGDIPIKPIDLKFFEYSVFFMAGPVPMRFAIGAGGSVGLRLTVGACFLSMKAFVRVTPFVGAKVYGSLALDIGFAAAGIQLTGYLLETQFPITASLTFNKFPLDVGIKIEVVLIPLRLRLSAFVKIRLLFFSKKWSFTIWEYTAPSIRGVVLDKPLVEPDKSPPNLLPTTVSKNKRAIKEGCSVTQLPKRDPSDPAFILEVAAMDEVSDIKRHYAIGSHPGGNNIQDWTEMGGPSVTVPVILEHGIPLYWTVKVTNSQGLGSTAQCFLNTYDMTVPNGKLQASYDMSSHPHKLSATVVIHEDSPLKVKQYKAVGVGQGQVGNTLTDWEVFSPSAVTENKDKSDELKHFAYPRRGKLTSEPFRKLKSFTDRYCAAECIKYQTKCISFDYDSQTRECLLHNSIEGEFTKIKHSGAFHNYQRIIGHTHMFEYDNLPLQHAELYFINAHVTNTLGYQSFFSSQGTIIDFTPPVPGHIVNATQDIMRHDKCSAAITQRCQELTWHPNHRIIIDGYGSTTVLNGHERMVDLEYTSSNNYISAHWDGFHDGETDIWGYTWAAGSTVCGTDVSPYDDPHKHLSGKDYWTHNGLTSDLNLQDGYYYTTVQALNSIVFGGALVTTVCHSKPILVDTTKPEVHSVGSYFYDEDFDILFLYYNVSDSLSGIKRVDFGLGHTKYDVKVRGYSEHTHIIRKKNYIVIEDVGIGNGVPAWIRLRAVDKVMLFATGHSEAPLLKDTTPPLAGKVLDGLNLHQDIAYQAANTSLCAHWKDFFDPDTGIDKYFVGFSLDPQNDTALAITEVPHLTKSYCYYGDLLHNTTYYATVVGVNRGLQPKTVNASSDGVLVDVTPPSTGWINDGDVKGEDMSFTHKQSEISAYYGNFSDSESGIKVFDINVYVNEKLRETFANGLLTTFEDHSIALDNGDNVKIEVSATNGAGSKRLVMSDGYTVDLTPPELVYLKDSETGLRYQTSNNTVFAKWNFEDLESGIVEYRMTIFAYHHGTKWRAWPSDESEKILKPTETNVMNVSTSLSLINGARYTVQVTALNQAQLATTHESDGIRVDTSPPIMKFVVIGLSVDDELLNENGQVDHLETGSIVASWRGRDEHSGVEAYLVGVGTSPGDVSLTNGYLNYGKTTHGHITGLSLRPFTEAGILYYVTVKSVNGANLMSKPLSSKAIYVMKDNVPGVVFDGRIPNNDVNFQADIASVAINFYGFESDACRIITYEWALGSEPGFSDVESFSSYGIVMKNQTHGFAQSNIKLDNGKMYYATVRAVTGHKCHEKFIVSTSDGVLVDNKAPHIEFLTVGNNKAGSSDQFYQESFESLSYSWNVIDGESGVAQQWWHYGSLPGRMDLRNKTIAVDSAVPVGTLSLSNSLTGFLTVETIDQAGNMDVQSTPPLTIDTTAPSIVKFMCSKFIVPDNAQIDCEWEIKESESLLSSVMIGIGEEAGTDDLVRFKSIPTLQNKQAFNLHSYVSNVTLKKVYVTLSVRNQLEMIMSLSREIKVANKPPTTGTVTVIKGNDSKESSCQIAQEYIDLKISGFTDSHSGLDRFEVSLGSSPGMDDILPPKTVPIANRVRLDRLALPAGSQVFVTVQAFNKIGLSSKATSRAVAISPNPRLYVGDGTPDNEVDFQTSLSSITANWQMTNGCPLKSIKWAVLRYDGAVIKPLQSVDSEDNILIDDQLDLENTKTYFVRVEVVDVLQRKFVAKTNGVSVNIEPPLPGTVSDGLYGDLEYQQSADVINAKWSDFGKPGSRDPTQVIVKYEVALGSDVSSYSTRINIHPFVDVALNKNYTFTGLSLVPKTRRYFVSVRATSASGSTVVVTSNGILVGFIDTLKPGAIDVINAQSSNTSLKATWSEFETELPILFYEVGLSSYAPSSNSSCHDLGTFDISPMQRVNFDTVMLFSNLSLSHGHVYFVMVRARDVADNCAHVTSAPIIVDQTKPIMGRIHVGVSTAQNTSYVKSAKSLHVEWFNFTDPESKVSYYDVFVYHQLQCRTSGEVDEGQLHLLYPPIRVTKDNEVTFEKLSLQLFTPYYVKVVATNGAGLNCTGWSFPIMVDGSPPIGGSIKYGRRWSRSLYYQSSLSSISVVIAIDYELNTTKCDTEKLLLLTHSSELSKNVTVLDEDDESNGHVGFYKKENVKVAKGRNNSLNLVAQPVLNGLAMSLPGFEFSTDIYEGRYRANIKGGKGDKIVTSFYISEEQSFSNFQSFRMKSVLSRPDNSKFISLNLTDADGASSNTTSNSNTTQTNTTFIVPSHNLTEKVMKSRANQTAQVDHEVRVLGPAVGLHIMGFDVKGDYLALFWGLNVNNEVKQEWITLEFNPYTSTAEYCLVIEQQELTGVETWNAKLLVDNEEKAILYNIKKLSNAKIGFRVWNQNDSVLNPNEKSSAEVSNIHLALEPNRDCMFGTAFHDMESKLKEIWIGVASREDGITDVAPFSLVFTPCSTCGSGCHLTCDPKCQNTGFTLYNFMLTNLTLSAGSMKSFISDNTTGQYFEPGVYHVVVKAVNHASESVTVVGDPLKIDMTPPVCENVMCLDPGHSKTEPTIYLGSKQTIGAFWECVEDESRVAATFIAVGSNDGKDDIVSRRNVGHAKRVILTQQYFNTSLEHGQVYWVTVEVVNLAGLWTRSSCNLTADFNPPNVTNAHVTVSGAKTDPELPPDILRSQSTSKIGFEWDSSEMDAEVYEWEIGTEKGKSDVLPQVLAGVKGSTGVEIDDGIMKYKGANVNTSLSNLSKNNRTDRTAAEMKTFYQTEPGRCTYQTLYALSKAKIKVKVKTVKICVARKGDIIKKLDINKESVISLDIGDEVTTLSNAESKQKMQLKIKGSNSSVMAGKLSKHDLKARYGSAASSEFNSYIKDPESSKDDGKVSRRLRNRIKEMTNETFFVAPTDGATQVNQPMEFRMPFNKSKLGKGEIPVIMFYDPDEDVWREMCESCNTCNDFATDENIDWENSILTVQVCNTRHLDKGPMRRRKKRAAETIYTISPTVYTVVVVDAVLSLEKSCVWQTCAQLANNAEEFVMCNTDRARESTRQDVLNKVSFSCGLTNGQVSGIQITYRPSVTDNQFERLFLHEGNSSSQMTNPLCYEDKQGNHTILSLSIGQSRRNKTCNAVPIPATSTVFKFHMIHNLGYLTGGDATFVIDCHTDRCVGQVPDIRLSAKRPQITAHVAKYGFPDDSIDIVNQHETVVAVLSLNKTSIAKGITAIDLLSYSENKTWVNATLMENGCFHKTNTPTDGFSRLREDDQIFMAISPAWNVSGLGTVGPDAIESIVYTAKIRICSKPNQQFCLASSCEQSAVDAELLTDEYTVDFNILVKIPANTNIVILIVGVVVGVFLVILVPVATICFLRWRDKKQRHKAVSDNVHSSESSDAPCEPEPDYDDSSAGPRGLQVEKGTSLDTDYVKRDYDERPTDEAGFPLCHDRSLSYLAKGKDPVVNTSVTFQNPAFAGTATSSEAGSGSVNNPSYDAYIPRARRQKPSYTKSYYEAYY